MRALLVNTRTTAVGVLFDTVVIMLQVSNKRTALDHHSELMNHHERQLESLTRLLNSQDQLSPPQPLSDWPISVPAVPVNNANDALIFPRIASLRSQSSSLTHLQSCPVEGLSCPVEGLSCPVEGPVCPVEGSACPVEGSSRPVEGMSCPVEGPVCPVEGMSCPVEGPVCPVEGLSCPVEGPVCPAEGSSCPVEGSSPPIEGSTPPVRSFACPAESLPGPVVGYTVQGQLHANIQSAEGLRHAPNSKVHPKEGLQHPSCILPVPCAPATQAASSSPMAATPPIVSGGLVEADMAAVHGLAGQMEADAVAAAMSLTVLKSAPGECAGLTSRQRPNAQLTAATAQHAQPQHPRQRNSNKHSGANSADSSLTVHKQLKSADFSAKSCQQHQTGIVAAPLPAAKNYYSRPSRLNQTVGALQRPQHHAADHAASCSLHEQQSAASGNSTRLLRQLPIRHLCGAGKAPSGFTQQQQTALPARWGCHQELTETQPASSAELSTTGGFHDDRSTCSATITELNHHRAQSQLLAFSDARAFLTIARTADAGSRAMPDGPEDPQPFIGAGSLRPALDALPAFQTMRAAGNASRAVCNGPGISTGTVGPISGASTATCGGLQLHPISMGRHNHDDISSTQPTEQIHDSAMPDAIMADEEPVSYSRRGRRICLPARFQMTPCQVKTHVFMCADVWKIRCSSCPLALLAQYCGLCIANFIHLRLCLN